MDDRINILISDLKEVSDDARETFGSLSSEQLNWKPSPTSWSVAQVFDHLNVANIGMLSKIEPVINRKHNPTFFERLPVFPKIWGNLVLKAVDPETQRKTKNPGIFDPTESDLDADVIQKFLENQAKIIALIKAGRDMDLARAVMTSPVAAFITYTVLEGFRIIAAHEKRHFQQAKRVTETDGFPKSAPPKF